MVDTKEAPTDLAPAEAEVVPMPVDYFDFGEDIVFALPDGVSSITHRVLNEGARAKYLKQTNRDVSVNRQTDEARFSLDIGGDRKALLSAAIVDWNLQSGGSPVAFSSSNLERFLTQADPKVLDLIEKDIRKANPWLLDEVSVDDIDEQIAELEELKLTKLDEEAKKDDSE